MTQTPETVPFTVEHFGDHLSNASSVIEVSLLFDAYKDDLMEKMVEGLAPTQDGAVEMGLAVQGLLKRTTHLDDWKNINITGLSIGLLHSADRQLSLAGRRMTVDWAMGFAGIASAVDNPMDVIMAVKAARVHLQTPRRPTALGGQSIKTIQAPVLKGE